MGQQTSTAKITAHDKAVFQLKQQRDKIKQYQKRINHLVEQQTDLAKQSLSGKNPDTTKAKFYLRCKKSQQATLRKTYDQLDTLEGLINTIEFKLVENELVKSLNQGNDILKQLNQQMNVQKIDKIMDDLYEERVKVDEVSDLLGEPLTSVDESEVDEEFNKMLRENTAKEPESKVSLPEVPSVIKDDLPEVPTEIPTDLPEVKVPSTNRSEALLS